jgi:hypothetical protein
LLRVGAASQVAATGAEDLRVRGVRRSLRSLGKHGRRTAAASRGNVGAGRLPAACCGTLVRRLLDTVLRVISKASAEQVQRAAGCPGLAVHRAQTCGMVGGVGCAAFTGRGCLEPQNAGAFSGEDCPHGAAGCRPGWSHDHPPWVSDRGRACRRSCRAARLPMAIRVTPDSGPGRVAYGDSGS